jgi:hypothetical protein
MTKKNILDYFVILSVILKTSFVSLPLGSHQFGRDRHRLQDVAFFRKHVYDVTGTVTRISGICGGSVNFSL